MNVLFNWNNEKAPKSLNESFGAFYDANMFYIISNYL